MKIIELIKKYILNKNSKDNKDDKVDNNNTTMIISSDKVKQEKKTHKKNKYFVIYYGGSKVPRDIYVINKPYLVIGRGTSCDIFFEDITVSRKHAILTCKNDVYYIKDNRSLNGVYINDRQLVNDKAIINENDTIGIGRFHMKFVSQLENLKESL